jgi:hypothetical protein
VTVADKEHPAAKAGRFVRAAGLAVGKASAAAREGSPAAPPPAARGESVPIPPASEPAKEHPAAKAGRYVRAAGVQLGREIDRRAEATAARPAPVAEPPASPPAPARTHGAVGRGLFWFFVLALVVLGLTILHFADLVPSEGRSVVRLVMAGIMGTEAFLLISNWHQANDRISQRLLTRMWGPRGPMNRRERTFARVLHDVLALLGIGFVAAAVFQLLVALHLGPA